MEYKIGEKYLLEEMRRSQSSVRVYAEYTLVEIHPRRTMAQNWYIFERPCRCGSGTVRISYHWHDLMNGADRTVRIDKKREKEMNGRTVVKWYLDGYTFSEIARKIKVSRDTLRDWIEQKIAKGEIERREGNGWKHFD